LMRDHVVTGSILDRSVAAITLEAGPLIRAAAVALAVALTAAAAQFTILLPFTAVPFTMGPLAVLLTGAALGARLGFVAQALYLAAGAAGLAVFTPSPTLPPGPLRLIGPTGGYLMAYPIAAFLTGYLAERGWDRRYLTSYAAMLAGLFLIFTGGVTWLAVAYTGSFAAAFAQGAAPFILADLVKAAAAAMILPQLWRFVGPAEGRMR
jgi:biotin transport system substrate-specific component